MNSQRYRPYCEYKNSGEEWLGKVPSHWDVVQIKHLSTIKRGASPRPIDDPKYFDDYGEYAWTRIADVTASDVYLIDAPQRLSTLGSSLSVKLAPGTLFLSIAGTVGKPCITGIKACIHDGFVYFSDLKMPTKFLFYVFAAEQAYKGLGKFGTQLNLNTDTVGGIKIGCTESMELEKIVSYLDHETARIDVLIYKQQQLIQLLKEKRQAVISHAVTKGLNPNARMKDSGVEWLGEVPEHWKVVPLVAAAEVIDPNPSHRNPTYNDEGFPFISTVEFVGLDDVEIDTSRRVDELTVIEQEERCKFRPGSIAFSRKGTIGDARILPADVRFALLDSVCVINCKNVLDHRFLYRQINSSIFDSQLGALTRGAALQQISVGRVRNIRICLPPLSEQGLIVSYLSKKVGCMNDILFKSEKQIMLLRERRTALISAAVTGKIDVRNWEPAQTTIPMEACA